MSTTRRSFLVSAACTVAAVAAPVRALAQRNSPFKVSVITDEISDDFDHACSVAANDFGLGWVEIRGMWGKSIVNFNDDDVARAQAVLSKYNLRVTDIASPLFKIDWPGAPVSKARSKPGVTPDRAKADAAFKKQPEVLEKCISLAKQFKTDKIRCFDFWRIDDVEPYRAAIADTLRSAADTAHKQGIALVLENEHECNTGTGREAVRLLKDVPQMSLNWDPGNAVAAGELDAFPAAWDLLPKERILHCHCKNAARDAAGKIGWSPVDVGYIDWAAQFRALHAAGYRNAVSLETHWRGAGTPEASSRVSWAGMKKSLQTSGTL